jgi:Tol biopolymer transport system component
MSTDPCSTSRRRRRSLTAALAGVVAVAPLVLAVPTASAALRDPELVSVSSDEDQAAAGAGRVTLASDDGRYVAFTSASNLGGSVQPPGTGMSDQIYLRDRVAGTTTMVSTDAAGVGVGAVLADFTPSGRHVLMWTIAALTPDDADRELDLYIRDLETGAYALVSEATGWPEEVATSPFASVSDDGRVVAFLARARATRQGGDYYEVYVRHVATTTPELVSVTRSGRVGSGRLPQISGNGRFVAFDSRDDDLVRRDTNDRRDAFVRDLRRHRTERVSVGSSGRQANRGLENGLEMSSDGRFVAFTSLASNLVRGDTNRAADVFVHDRRRDLTRRVSVSTRGGQAPRGATLGEMSASGRHVAFRTASHLGGPRAGKSYDDYLHDRRSGGTRYLAESVGIGAWTLSDDGWAAFSTSARLSAADSGELSVDAYVARFR